MGKLKDKSTEIQPASNTGSTLSDLIKSQWPKVEAVMPKTLRPERVFQLAISAINRTPKLAECTPQTILSCLLQGSTLGLEPSNVDGLRSYWILPFSNRKTGQTEATFMLGYAGIIRLARRSGELQSIDAQVVYRDDEFDWELGDNPYIRHKPANVKHKDSDITHAYMVAKFLNGGIHRVVMTREELDSIRKRSKSPNNGPWVSDYPAMCKKTVIRAAKNYLPLTAEADSALAADETAGSYEATIDPIIVEPEIDTESLPETVEAEVIQNEPQKEQEPVLQAVCGSCGLTIDVTPDCTQEDLAEWVCKGCGESAYKFQESK